MSNAPSTRNILKAYRAASMDDITEGMSWYADALEFAGTLDYTVSHAAGAIAALSPMLSWPRNQIAAMALYNGTPISGVLGANVSKARAIRNGAMPMDILGGNKVRSFYANIVGLNDANTVTIDRHAIDAAYGAIVADSVKSAISKSPKRYGEIADFYIRAARIASKESGTDIMPKQLQAIVWCYWRRNHAQAFHG